MPNQIPDVSSHHQGWLEHAVACCSATSTSGVSAAQHPLRELAETTELSERCSERYLAWFRIRAGAYGYLPFFRSRAGVSHAQ